MIDYSETLIKIDVQVAQLSYLLQRKEWLRAKCKIDNMRAHLHTLSLWVEGKKEETQNDTH